MRLGFSIQNVGDVDFLSPVDISDRHVDLRKIWHLLNYVISSPCIPLLMKSSMICESLKHWGVFFNYHVFPAEEFPCIGYP